MPADNKGRDQKPFQPAQEKPGKLVISARLGDSGNLRPSGHFDDQQSQSDQDEVRDDGGDPPQNAVDQLGLDGSEIGQNVGLGLVAHADCGVDGAHQGDQMNGLAHETLEPTAKRGDQDDDAQGEIQAHRKLSKNDPGKVSCSKIRLPLRILRGKSSGVSDGIGRRSVAT